MVQDNEKWTGNTNVAVTREVCVILNNVVSSCRGNDNLMNEIKEVINSPNQSGVGVGKV